MGRNYIDRQNLFFEASIICLSTPSGLAGFGGRGEGSTGQQSQFKTEETYGEVE